MSPTASTIPSPVRRELVDALERDREHLAALHERIAEEIEQLATERDVSDLLDPESPRPALDDVELERTAALRAALARRQEEVELALRSIRRRRYGTCVDCGAAIALVRLRAVPSTRWCISCKVKREYRPGRRERRRVRC